MKNIILAATFSIITTAAAAQTKPAAPASPPTYTFTFSSDVTVWISKGLDELPAKIANPIFQEMAKQINEQNEAFKKSHQMSKGEEQNHEPSASATKKENQK